MVSMKKLALFMVVMVVFSLAAVPLFGQGHGGHQGKAAPAASSAEQAAFSPMPEPGKKVPMANGFYLIYGFDKRPKLGTVIMKVEIFSPDGKKDTSFEARADAGMPSMRGAHETGDRAFALSKKGDYLLPINIVMPGGWEIRLTVTKEGKTVYQGRYNFDV